MIVISPPKTSKHPQGHINGQSNPDSNETMTRREKKQASNANYSHTNLKTDDYNKIISESCYFLFSLFFHYNYLWNRYGIVYLP